MEAGESSRIGRGIGSVEDGEMARVGCEIGAVWAGGGGAESARGGLERWLGQGWGDSADWAR